MRAQPKPKLEALVAAQARLIATADKIVVITRRKHDLWDEYDAAKIEIEKLGRVRS